MSLGACCWGGAKALIPARTVRLRCRLPDWRRCAYGAAGHPDARTRVRRLSYAAAGRPLFRWGRPAVLVTRGFPGPGMSRGQPVLQETVGQVHWPSGEIVRPQLLPLPLGVAERTYWLGYVALTFQVE